MNNGKCPSCDKEIQFVLDTGIDNTDNRIIDCPHCHSILEIMVGETPYLDWAEDPIISSFRHGGAYRWVC